MSWDTLLLYLDPGTGSVLLSPAAFALFVALAVGLVWMAFRPAGARQAVDARLSGYLGDGSAEGGMDRPFVSRAIVPIIRRVLGVLGRLLPHRQTEEMWRKLRYAGEPGGLTPIDFAGVRILAAVLPAGAYLVLFGPSSGMAVALRNALLLAMLGYFAPRLWLNMRVRRRQHQIERALPDALDMMTVGVEAGLAFESAMIKVGEQWDNPLTRELRRVVGEMRVGTPRDMALRRMVERTGVEDLSTFVAILIQSTQLGVPIAQVLHSQAAEMRLKRRQRAEQLARQASVKMIFPLIVCIFPALMVVLVGPAIPQILGFFVTMSESLRGLPAIR